MPAASTGPHNPPQQRYETVSEITERVLARQASLSSATSLWDDLPRIEGRWSKRIDVHWLLGIALVSAVAFCLCVVWGDR
ncbi:MAG: hypothetical protein ACR2JE_16235 [Acidobacteriaceae bacterium]